MKYATSFFALSVGVLLAYLVFWRTELPFVWVMAFAHAGWLLFVVPMVWLLPEPAIHNGLEAALLGAGLALAAIILVIFFVLEPSSKIMGFLLPGVAALGAIAGLVHFALRRTRLRQRLDSRPRHSLAVLLAAPVMVTMLASGAVQWATISFAPCQTYLHGPLAWRVNAYDQLARDLATRRDYGAAQRACAALFPAPGSASAVEVVDPRFATGRRFGWRFMLGSDQQLVVSSDLGYLDP